MNLLSLFEYMTVTHFQNNGKFHTIGEELDSRNHFLRAKIILLCRLDSNKVATHCQST